VVGLPFNLDQYLCMTAIAEAGAGLLVRSGTATTGSVRAAVDRALHDEALRDGARRAAEGMRVLDAPSEFRRLLADIGTTAS
jgi:UDP:flavonoid glycosyltransferase YjiC (YdhE family)